MRSRAARQPDPRPERRTAGPTRGSACALGAALLALLALVASCAAHAVPAGRGGPPPASAASPGASPSSGPKPQTGRLSYLLVVLKSADSLALVDPEGLQVLDRFPCGKHPHEVVASAGRAYVSNYGDASLTIVDLASRRVAKTVDTTPFGHPHGLAAAAQAVWFTAEAARAVARYDPARDRVDWSMGTGRDLTHMVAVTRDGGRVFTTDIASGGVTSIDVASGRMRHLDTGRGAEGIALTPDQRELWVTNRSDSTVSVIDLHADSVVATLKAGPFPIRVAFTPEGRQALVANAMGNSVSVWEVAARRELERIAVGKMPVGLLIAPDGRRAFVACTGSNEIMVLDLTRRTIAGKFSPGREPDGMAWAQVEP